MASRELPTELFLYTALGWGETEDVVTWLAGPSLPPSRLPLPVHPPLLRSFNGFFLLSFSSLPWLLLIFQFPSLVFLHPWTFPPNIIYIFFFLLLRSFVRLLSEYSLHAFISYASIFSFVSYFFPSPYVTSARGSLDSPSSSSSQRKPFTHSLLLPAWHCLPSSPCSSLLVPDPPCVLPSGSRHFLTQGWSFVS